MIDKIKLPYALGEIMVLKDHSNVQMKICGYRMTLEGDVFVSLIANFDSEKADLLIEIPLTELRDKWVCLNSILDTEQYPNTYIYSKDSEYISSLLESFSFDSSKREKVLEKYRSLF